MKIVIAGAGEVGTHLAKMLSNEDQDIILLDNDQSRLDVIDSNYNLMTWNGSTSSFESLRDVGVDNADLYIAVTPYETRNITSCAIAKKLGAKETVARIDNSEFLIEENGRVIKSLGVDFLIYPENLAADEIAVGLDLVGICGATTQKHFGHAVACLCGFAVDGNLSIGRRNCQYEIISAYRGRLWLGRIGQGERHHVCGGGFETLDAVVRETYLHGQELVGVDVQLLGPDAHIHPVFAGLAHHAAIEHRACELHVVGHHLHDDERCCASVEVGHGVFRCGDVVGEFHAAYGSVLCASRDGCQKQEKCKDVSHVDTFAQR